MIWYEVLSIVGLFVLPVVGFIIKLYSDVKQHANIIPDLKKIQDEMKQEHSKINSDIASIKTKEEFLSQKVDELKQDMKEGFRKLEEVQKQILDKLTK
jgi:peptidoglycan hydrolase CwlO-like protein